MSDAQRPTRVERLAAWGWAGLLLGCSILLASLLRQATPLDTRITALLPETPRTALIERAERRLTQAFEDRFVLLVSGEESARLITDLKVRLQASGSVAGFDETTVERPDDALAPYRYRLLAEPLASGDTEAWVQRALARLFTPGSDADPRRDPFGLLDAWLAQRLDGPIHLVDGLPAIVDRDRHWFVISGRLSASPYDMPMQRRLVAALSSFHDAHPEAELLRSGLVFHAAAGASQAKREVSTIGLGSLLGIGLLLWATFRRGSILASLLLPVGCGVLFALPLTWAIFGTLNLLTLAFGASLIGIAVDYALHLQCARQLAPERPLSRLWPGLLLGLASSLVAYLAQLATPLPGLRQMATFAALGLLGAWLTVRLWLPRFAPRPHGATARIAARLNRLRLPSRAPYRWTLLGLLGLFAGGLIVARLTTSDDLRQLNPSPDALIAEQQRVQALLERPTGSRYLVVTADREAELLERLEALEAPLARLHEQGHLADYRHLAQAVPSPATQQDNLARVRQAYTRALPPLIERAGLPGHLHESAFDALRSVPLLTLDEWLKMPLARADSMLWLGEDSAPGTESRELAALIALGDADDVAQQALARLASSSHVHYQDRVATLSEHLARLRNQIALWLAVAVAGLALLFGWRYRWQAWRVLLPPLGAVVATLALFSALGIGLTLFHLLGLLLVLGIGLDAGIFSSEHPDSPAAWLAISLSCASSLLAFGLLAFSATPALHYLGLTCLIGLAATWGLVPFARAATMPTTHEHDAIGDGQ
ncbi:MMPL family transporter [Litchfieldella rifensis]|uniref:MMPL family transporter n=1 Tax=Litchfieldella rifensis TaxID=762643 RepID=A0ABV7LSK7_9GAMM